MSLNLSIHPLPLYTLSPSAVSLFSFLLLTLSLSLSFPFSLFVSLLSLLSFSTFFLSYFITMDVSMKYLYFQIVLTAPLGLLVTHSFLSLFSLFSLCLSSLSPLFLYLFSLFLHNYGRFYEIPLFSKHINGTFRILVHSLFFLSLLLSFPFSLFTSLLSLLSLSTSLLSYFITMDVSMKYLYFQIILTAPLGLMVTHSFFSLFLSLSHSSLFSFSLPFSLYIRLFNN